ATEHPHVVTVAVVPTVPAVAAVRVGAVLTVPAVVAGVLTVPMVRGRVASRGGQRVGDTQAISGHRLPVRGLMPTHVTVGRLVVSVCNLVALVWPMPCVTVVVARWRTHGNPSFHRPHTPRGYLCLR